MAEPEPEIGTTAQAERTVEPEESATAGSDDQASDWAQGESDGEVVYRRAGPTEDNGSRIRSAGESGESRGREIAPAITPLVIGFTLLLALISLLGYFSVRRMDDVGVGVLELEQHHAAKLGLLLKLRLALTSLNNEARARQDTAARRELKPPFEFRLSTARDEMNRLLRELERPPLSDDTSWRRFRGDLQSYVEVTQDPRRYSLEGFSKFRIADTELDGLLSASGAEQDEVSQKSGLIEQEARRQIRLWSVIALLVGAMVAGGTIWEVQRRFRQMRQSMFEARRERVFTNQLLEGMVSAVAAIDENDRIRSANAAFFKIFPGASIGASLYEKFAPPDGMRMLEAATSSRLDKATYCGRWVCRIGESGILETLDVYSSPLAINGGRGQIVTLVDVTEVAEAERGLRRTESLAAVGQAITQVAHEIRNPLGSIRLGVSMLRDSVNDQEALATIELVERGIKHLNKLVVEVTEFSRQKHLEPAETQLHELLNSSLDLVADRIRQTEAAIEKRFSSQSILGNWDAHQLRQVFVNVVANAIDASPKGAPITISTNLVTLQGRGNGSGFAGRRYARVTIADQGKGIDEATRQRVFEPFFSTKKRGTGLGLAIVKQIVEQHAGKITVESEPGKGASFIIDLPLEHARDKDDGKRSRPEG
jgi:signal transduction histidine kinase